MNWNRHDWAFLLLVTLLGATLRLYQLGVTPPGFQFDEAFNAIDAAQVLHGNRPLFLPANGGREVIYTYLQAGLGALLGVDVYSLRLTSALLGIVAVATTYALLRRLFQRQSREIALFTSLTLAVSLWHIHFSHYGIRVITMPVILSGVFGCYWLGMHSTTRRTRLLAFALSGLLTGLSVWAHPSGRFVPFVLLFYTLWLLWQAPARRLLRVDSPLAGLLLTGLVAFLIFLPLGLEFVRHPDWFTGHATEVAVFAERVGGEAPWRALLENLLRVVGMFSVAGDLEWAHGPAGRPVFDPLLSIPFVLGIGLWMVRLVRGALRDPDRDALALLALWSLVMLLPSVFSDAAPNYSRTLPALPAIFVAVGLGLRWLSQWPILRWKVGGVVLALVLVAASGVIAFFDYFIRFPANPEVYYLYEANKLEALDYLEERSDEYEIYLHPLWANHPPVRFLRRSQQVKPLDTVDALVLPPVGKGAIYAYPPERAEQAETLAPLWPGVKTTNLTDRLDNPLLALVQVEATQLAGWPAPYQPTYTGERFFDDAPTLLGMQPMAQQNELVLLWRAEEPVTQRNLTTFVHLINAAGQRVGQSDKLPGNGSYPTPVWSPGERVIERYAPEISDPCAGGDEVEVWVGWYELAADGARRPLRDGTGDMALAGRMTPLIVGHPLEQLDLPLRLDLPVQEGLSLLAVANANAGWQAGGVVSLELYLQARPTLAEELLELRLVAVDQAITLWSEPLAPGVTWREGEVICRRVRTRLPAELTSETYELYLSTKTGDALVFSSEIK
jgi:4-amino-4-deoxy-L-arabinose transferase-like glycosyltransferase